MKTGGREAGKPTKGAYIIDNDKIQLLSGERELLIIRFARYDNGTILLASGNEAVVLTKQSDKATKIVQ